MISKKMEFGRNVALIGRTLFELGRYLIAPSAQTKKQVINTENKIIS